MSSPAFGAPLLGCYPVKQQQLVTALTTCNLAQAPLRRAEPELAQESICLDVLAMIPYLLQGFAVAGLWQISYPAVAGLETAGAVTFLFNSLYDLWVALKLIGATCSVAPSADAELKPPRCTEERPRLGIERSYSWEHSGRSSELQTGSSSVPVSMHM